MALAKGKSSIRCGPVTLHTETAIHVAKQLTDVSIRLFYQRSHRTLVKSV